MPAFVNFRFEKEIINVKLLLSTLADGKTHTNTLTEIFKWRINLFATVKKFIFYIFKKTGRKQENSEKRELEILCTCRLLHLKLDCTCRAPGDLIY